MIIIFLPPVYADLHLIRALTDEQIAAQLKYAIDTYLMKKEIERRKARENDGTRDVQ